MNPKQIFESKQLNIELLSKHVNNTERRKYIRSLLTPGLIHWLYVEQQMSANSIYEYLKSKGVKISGADRVINLVKEYLQITPRSISQSTSLPNVRSKYIKTLQEKYGDNVTNISQIQDIKTKKENTCFNKYGVTNNFKSSVIKNKIKNYWITNFNVEHPSELRITKQGFILTKPHKQVIDILNKQNIIHEVETNKYFKAYNPITEKRFCPRVDIYISSLNLVIEVNGCYWHAKPTKYKPTDIFNTVFGPLEAQQIWAKDKIKIDHLKRLGFNIEIIWEDEISEEYITSILSKYKG